MKPTLDTAFLRIAEIAAAGERCPTGDVIASKVFGALAREGRIRVRVFEKNWRVVDILVGPHAGKSTADMPGRRPGQRPYKVIDVNSPPLKGTEPAEYRSVPWKPGDPRPVKRA